MRKVTISDAVALGYDKYSKRAPTVLAKGERLHGEQIVNIARKFGVPVVSRPELVDSLKKLAIDEEIPTELFEAVAVVLAELERSRSSINPGDIGRSRV